MSRKWALVVAAAGLLAGAAEAQAQDDARQVEGTWAAVSTEIEGTSIPEIEGESITFQGGKMTIKGRGGELRASYKVDAGKTPRQIDIIPTQGANAGRALPGIYAVAGDELKLCYFIYPAAQHPTDFSAKKGSDRMLIVLRRQKP